MKQKNKEQSEEKLRRLIAKSENLYREIKKKLTPIILNLVEEKQKTIGVKEYWELCRELEKMFGLNQQDYEKIIHDLCYKERILEHGWVACYGGYLRLINSH